MKKLILAISVVVYTFLCASCTGNRNVVEKNTENTKEESKADNEISSEPEEIILLEEERLFWPNHIFYYDGYDMFEEPLPGSYGTEYGKCVIHEPFKTFVEKQKSSDEIYYVTVLAEISGVGIKEFYHNYLKELGIRTQLDNLTQRELEQYLERVTEEQKDVDNESGVLVYVTREQLLSLEEYCPENMMIWVRSSGRRHNVDVTNDNIEIYTKYYGEELIPIRYYDENGDEVEKFVTKEEAKMRISKGIEMHFAFELLEAKWLN